MTSAPAGRHVALTAWRGASGLGGGTHQGTVTAADGLVIGDPAGTLRYADPYGDGPAAPVRYEWAAWVSPEVRTGFGATEVIPSWNATTPEGSWLLVEARAASDLPGGGRRWTRWLTLARWADSDREIHPTTDRDERDGPAIVRTDVLAAEEGVTFSAYQLRVSLVRRPGSDARPVLGMLAAMASRVPTAAPEQVSPGGAAWGVELAVPAYSQQLHRIPGVEDRGGSSWCSPTSTSMLLAFHDRSPRPADYGWVDPSAPDRFVVHAARQVFDHAYGGPGNWSFNAAYAARHGTEAFVTRLRSLTEAEAFVAAGLPLAATVSFTAEELTGAGYSTDGHLLTIVGFTADGDVVCNDPASHLLASNDEVRVVYDRAEFERVWLGSAGGVVYVVHPVDVPLPPAADPAEPSW